MSEALATSASATSLAALKSCELLLEEAGQTFVAITSGTAREGSVLVVASGHRADELRELISTWSGGVPQELPDRWRSWWIRDSNQDRTPDVPDPAKRPS